MNEKLTEFLEENKDITVLGFAWSLYWRLVIAIFVVYLVVLAVVLLLSASY